MAASRDKVTGYKDQNRVARTRVYGRVGTQIFMRKSLRLSRYLRLVTCATLAAVFASLWGSSGSAYAAAPVCGGAAASPGTASSAGGVISGTEQINLLLDFLDDPALPQAPAQTQRETCAVVFNLELGRAPDIGTSSESNVLKIVPGGQIFGGRSGATVLGGSGFGGDGGDGGSAGGSGDFAGAVLGDHSNGGGGDGGDGGPGICFVWIAEPGSFPCSGGKEGATGDGGRASRSPTNGSSGGAEPATTVRGPSGEDGAR